MQHSFPGRGDQDLLVLTDQPRRGCDFLRMPFREATVLAVDDLEGIDSHRQFATVVVDRSPFDLGWLGPVVGRVRSAQSGAQIVVAVDQPGESPPDQAVAGTPFDGLAWEGLMVAHGRICAMLRAAPSGGSPDQVGPLLATAHAAARLAGTVAGREGTRVAVSDAERVLARQVEDQYQSERALLAHLERLADRRPRPEPLAQTLRAVIRGSWLGPPARVVWHGGRRITGRLRWAGAALRRVARRRQ